MNTKGSEARYLQMNNKTIATKLDQKKHSVLLPESNLIFNNEKKISKDAIRNKITENYSTQ